MIQKIFSKKPVFQAKWFTVNELEVEIKPDIIRTHHNIERKPTVFIFPLEDDGQLYLTSQYRYNLGKEAIEGVAGYLEAGEEPLAAAKRELREETGLIAKDWQQIATFELSGGVIQGNVYMFVAKGLEKGTTQFDEDEDIKTIKMPLEKVTNKVINGEINTLASVAGLLLVDKLRQEGKL